MEQITVVTESSVWGDKKKTVNILKRSDVQGWINEKVNPMGKELNGLCLSAEELKREIKNAQQAVNSQKGENDHFEGWLKALEESKEIARNDIVNIRECIKKIPENCAQDFKKIIEDNLTHPLAIFAQQIEDIKGKLSSVDNIRRDCEDYNCKFLELKAECQTILHQVETCKKEMQETLRQITEQAKKIRIYEPRGIFRFLFKQTKPVTKQLKETNNAD